MASRALSARLRIAVVELVGIDDREQISSSNTDSISICSPSVGRSSFAVSMISVLTSVSRGCERLLAREREQMLGEIGAARGGLVDHPRDGGELRLVLDGVGQDLDRAGDHGQDIVEVVRDAAGELADRLHLLGLPDALLGGDLVGQVADEAVEHEAVAASSAR